ncbi:MAG TPA: hypothetical protein PK443_01555 [bacterium]|nr:hypothetical protein [bacterium]
MFLSLLIPSFVYSQDPPTVEILSDEVIFIEQNELYYDPGSLKFNLSDGKSVKLDGFVYRGKDYAIIRYFENIRPVAEFKYEHQDDLFIIREFITYTYKENGLYIKKIYDARNGNIIRLIEQHKDDNGVVYKSIIMEEKGKKGSTMLTMHIVKDGRQSLVHHLEVDATMASKYPEYNIKMERYGLKYIYYTELGKFGAELKSSMDNIRGSLTFSFYSDNQDLKVFLDYKPNQAGQTLKYPKIKVITFDRSKNSGSEVVTKTSLDYNTEQNRYEVSNLEVKTVPVQLSKEKNSVKDFKRKAYQGELLYKSVSKDIVAALLNEYLSNKLYPAYIKDFDQMIEVFNSYIIEHLDGFIGKDEAIVLFGQGNTGGLYDYIKINTGVEYYRCMAIMYGALSTASGLLKDKAISNVVVETFNKLGLIDVATVSSAVDYDYMQKQLRIELTPKFIVRYSDGIIKYASSMIKL